jgi:hypothetical protein
MPFTRSSGAQVRSSTPCFEKLQGQFEHRSGGGTPDVRPGQLHNAERF